ncbi:MAG: transcriptional repressor [Fimbriimonadaceae bacterium]|nr:transcriptional repressor [Fimbriimonadaceae bacterium]
MKKSHEPSPDLAAVPPSAYEIRALDELRASGYRITMPRVQVIRALATAEVALSAYAIHERIRRTGGKIDVVSVYRILETLQELRLVLHVGIADGYVACEPLDSEVWSSAVIVNQSSRVVHRHDPSQGLVDQIAATCRIEGFEPIEIKIEVLGTAITS